MDDLLQQIRQYAQNNYEHDGWDYVVECFDDETLLQHIEGATTLDEAIKTLTGQRGILTLKNERRQDMQALRDDWRDKDSY